METPPKKVPILKKIFGALDIISAVWMAGPFGFLLTKKTPPSETPPQESAHFTGDFRGVVYAYLGGGNRLFLVRVFFYLHSRSLFE